MVPQTRSNHLTLWREKTGNTSKTTKPNRVNLGSNPGPTELFFFHCLRAGDCKWPTKLLQQLTTSLGS
jgi:hypothetical protein